MKKKFLAGFNLLQLLIVVALLALLSALALPTLHAAENFQPNYYVNVLTNGTTTVAASSTSNITTRPFVLRQGRGVSILPLQVGTNASTANVIYRFEGTADGTNYTTTGPLLVTNALNGTTAVRGLAVIPPSQLDNLRAIKLVSIQNAHNAAINVTNVVLSQDNQ